MDDWSDSASEVGDYEHEPYSTLESGEIMSSGDEFGPSHYYDTSDILDPNIETPLENSSISVENHSGKIAAVKSPPPHFTATDVKLAVERPTSPASSQVSRVRYDGEISFDYDRRTASCAATTLAPRPCVGIRSHDPLVDSTTVEKRHNIFPL